MKYRVGSLVRLKVGCMGNRPETRGVCYEVYEIGGHPGASFIFENGSYDGFSVKEQELFLKEDGFCEPLSGYQFTNVMRLSSDFDIGIFDKALK